MEQEDVPYNDKNILIGESDINKLLKTYGIKIKCLNVDIYRKALVHKSYTTRKNENFVTGNLNCPNGQMLAHLCDKVGLDKWIIISKQIENNGGRKNYKIMEDIFEAFICAIFLDFNNKKIKIKNFELISGLGFQIAENWIINVIEDKVDLVELIKQNKNYKDKLIKYFQHTYMKLPIFYESNIENINNKKIFTIVVKNDNQILGTGIGETKKLAEQLASEKALQYLNIN